ncbi:MAG: hypothetical protein DRI46_03845 [Chloroflexi bacterium]|nr:MAG: hypothetical protein DRI46_03845 [Chloroflexota bacterium]
MIEFLRYIRDIEYLAYFILGVLTVWQLRNFFIAWEELRAAAFGLEKESAQMRLNRSAALLVVLLFLGAAVFGLVSFIIPAVPGVDPIPTSTIDLLATSTATIAPETVSGPTITAMSGPSGTPSLPEGCVPGEVMITYPENNSVVSGIVEIEGTANIEDFGFYKFEVSAIDSDNWLTIQAGDKLHVDDELGYWDTSQLEPGNYSLRLVVLDNQGIQRTPCTVDIFVEMSEE